MFSPTRNDDLRTALLAPTDDMPPAPAMRREFAAFCLNGNWSVVVVVLALISAAWQGYHGLSPDPVDLVTALFTAVLVIAALKGLRVVEPNEAIVLTRFGRYVGTLLQSGLYWANPLATNHRISLRTAAFISDVLKVNDAHGNPIEVAIAVTWRVEDTALACFEVENPAATIALQSESVVRSTAARYPYARRDADPLGTFALLSHGDAVADTLHKEVQRAVLPAGLAIVSLRIIHLAYAPEVAQAMLRRQQVEASIGARHLLVRGATEMVKLALEKLHNEGVVHLDSSQRAAMVSNLMVALVSERESSANTGPHGPK